MLDKLSESFGDAATLNHFLPLKQQKDDLLSSDSATIIREILESKFSPTMT